ncbi:MAG: FAD-dependent monooxygenase, partial [Pedobacter sp.]
IDPSHIIWNSHFIAMEQKNDGWMLHFKNKESVYADVVIAADGANSKIRPYVTDIQPFYSGITMLEGNIYNAEKAAPNIFKLLRGGKIMAFGNEKNILMGQKGNGEIGFYASFKTDENWAKNNGLNYSDRAQMLDWFKANYTEWSNIWGELFESTTVPFIPRPIYCMPLDQKWKSLSNLTLIGDAAHVMPPFAGEGVNMAMLDALELSEHLTSNQHQTLLEVISTYESSMLNRAAIVSKESLDNGFLMHTENSLNDMLSFFSAH